MNDMDPNTKPTFRRFEEGATYDDWELQEKIFQADTSSSLSPVKSLGGRAPSPTRASTRFFLNVPTVPR